MRATNAGVGGEGASIRQLDSPAALALPEPAPDADDAERDPATQGIARRRGLLRSSGTVVGANSLAQVISALRSFVVARLLAPERFGLLQVALLVFEYGRSCHFGLLHGMNKTVSRAVGSQRIEEAHRAKNTALTGTMTIGLVLLAGVPIYALLRPDAGQQETTTIAVGLLAALVYQLYNFNVSMLRAQRRIGAAGRSFVLFSLCYASLAIAGAWAWGLTGVYVAFVASYALMAIYAARVSAWRFRIAWHVPTLRHLFRIGLPVVVVDLFSVAAVTLDRLLVIHFHGVVGLALYSLAKRVFAMAGTVAASLNWVTEPDFLEDLGRDSRLEVPRARLLVIASAAGVLLPPLFACAALVIALPLRWLGPEYAGAIPPARVLLLGAGLLPLAGVSRSTLVALDKERLIVGAQLIGMVCLLVAALLLNVMGAGLVGFAIASVGAQGITAGCALVAALWATQVPLGSAWRSVGRILVPQLATLLALGLVCVAAADPSPQQSLLAGGWLRWPQGWTANAGAALAIASGAALGAWAAGSAGGAGAALREKWGARAAGRRESNQ